METDLGNAATGGRLYKTVGGGQGGPEMAGIGGEVGRAVAGQMVGYWNPGPFRGWMHVFY